ncbi:glycoside hydrolase family 3 N-terminal domain-containing protein [Hymenobacter sp. AT01-02]|uniref:glycoside hydrolase family 3 N-terminal domain-containing protein n=1 Tax=Hymenobacter sp. AT01-02 TaxID=1571877 RepID=UPI000ADAF124|nr:glycoside hydrolase family 3 N-terminal domain-containing protein [Hymenobacter sp. AT01-02]
MKKRLLFSGFLACLSLSGQAQQAPAAYLDPSKPVSVRVRDLISRLTLEEKADQMMYNSKAIERLNIPAYNWWNEALHGVGRAGAATVFPQAIGLGASFDDDLALRVSTAISDEARAMYNAAVAKATASSTAALLFGPPTSTSSATLGGEGGRKPTVRTQPLRGASG